MQKHTESEYGPLYVLIAIWQENITGSTKCLSSYKKSPYLIYTSIKMKRSNYDAQLTKLVYVKY